MEFFSVIPSRNVSMYRILEKFLYNSSELNVTACCRMGNTQKH